QQPDNLRNRGVSRTRATARNIYSMTINRRDFLRASALTGGALATGAWSAPDVLGTSPILAEPVTHAPEPLRILILGGTGLTGPHQVRYAVARGHKVTVFNRGRHNERLPN